MAQKILDGRVIKAVASKFFVDVQGDVKVCFARKRLKNDGIIYVGDYVSIAKERDSFVIEEVKPRKNRLIRPYVSNVDVCFIVVAPEPEPDFLLVDKVIVNCLIEGITPILVKNKCDTGHIDTSEYENVLKSLNAVRKPVKTYHCSLTKRVAKRLVLQDNRRWERAVFSMRFSTATNLKSVNSHAK